MQTSITLRTKLIRAALILVAIIAVISSFSMVYEWISISKTASDSDTSLRLIRLFSLVVVNFVMTIFLVSGALLAIWVRVAKSLPDLRGWHTTRPTSEFCAAHAKHGYTLDDYLAQEKQIFQELDALIAGPWREDCSGAYCRYNPNSICSPNSIFDHDWNRTFVLDHPAPVGGALLLHGLSDSPYSLRSIGQRLFEEGYTVVWLRLPGHGTNPGGLAAVSSADWSAAVRIAAAGLRGRLPENTPMIIGGYSNGGALSVEYMLAALQEDSLPVPNAIILFSPMIGINPLAKITRLYHMVALISRNQKAQWSSVFAEIEPFKYSSWPMNANVQAWSVTQSVEKKLQALEESARLGDIPPILAMQSVVDSTVVVPKLITVLFDRLKSSSSELFLFDVDRADWLGDLLNFSFERSVVPKLKNTDRPYQLVVLRNSKDQSEQLTLSSRHQGVWTEKSMDLAWPKGVVSLSHVAVPFPPDDPVYGDGRSDDAGNPQLTLGTVAIRAEPSALMIPGSVFTRCRHNPFYRFMEDRVVGWLSRTTSSN